MINQYLDSKGAYMKNFSDFEKHFTNTKIINLDQNYRSTQNIVNLSNSIVSNIDERQKRIYFLKILRVKK